MTDMELLYLAAKAARMDIVHMPLSGPSIASGPRAGSSWNPLDDDGAALRLAVDVGLFIEPFTDGVFAEEKMGMVTVRAFLNDGLESVDIDEPIEAGDPYAATRRAIVRAAAELGKNRSD